MIYIVLDLRTAFGQLCWGKEHNSDGNGLSLYPLTSQLSQIPGFESQLKCPGIKILQSKIRIIIGPHGQK